MRCEWDDKKQQSNLEKHGIEFVDVVSVLDDTAALTREDEGSEELRFVTLGSDATGRLLVVVYTYRDEDVVRIISTRRATRAEQTAYER